MRAPSTSLTAPEVTLSELHRVTPNITMAMNGEAEFSCRNIVTSATCIFKCFDISTFQTHCNGDGDYLNRLFSGNTFQHHRTIKHPEFKAMALRSKVIRAQETNDSCDINQRRKNENRKGHKEMFASELFILLGTMTSV